MDNKKEIISRGLIRKGEKFLVCRRKGSDYWFLPGGHIDPGENGKEALERELMEERGSKIKISAFAGVIENFFYQDGKKISEINLIFEAEEVKDLKETQSMEDHLEFDSVNLDQFKEKNVLPVAIKEGIIQWSRQRKPFYICHSE